MGLTSIGPEPVVWPAVVESGPSTETLSDRIHRPHTKTWVKKDTVRRLSLTFGPGSLQTLHRNNAERLKVLLCLWSSIKINMRCSSNVMATPPWATCQGHIEESNMHDPKGSWFSYFISSVILKLSGTSIQIVRVVVRLMILSFQFKHVARQRVINRMKHGKPFLTQLRYQLKQILNHHVPRISLSTVLGFINYDVHAEWWMPHSSIYFFIY